MQKTLFKLFLVYFFAGLSGTFIFMLLLWTKLFADEAVLFFRPLLLILVATIFIASILVFAKHFKHLVYVTFRDIIIISLLLLFGNFYLYGNIAFNVARSNSMILVRYLYDHQHEYLSEKQITNYVQEEYFHKYRAVHVRIKEQMAIGNIGKNDKGYFLTPKGAKVVESLGYIASFYNIDNNFLTQKSSQ